MGSRSEPGNSAVPDLRGVLDAMKPPGSRGVGVCSAVRMSLDFLQPEAEQGDTAFVLHAGGLAAFEVGFCVL